MNRRSCLPLLGAALCSPAARAAETPALPDRAALLRAAESGFALLDRLYWSPAISIWLDRKGADLRDFYAGRLNPPWWSCANAVEAILDLAVLTGDKSRFPALAAMHDLHVKNGDLAPMVEAELKRQGQWKPEDKRRPANRPRNSTKPGFDHFNNEYLDDSGWWGRAWLKMHRATGEAKYLATARAIHAHISAHRLPDGGGVLWNLEHEEKKTNAISNGLFLVLSAGLYEVTGEKPFLDDAMATYQWYKDKGLYDGIGIVDAPGHKGDHWTYNQGVWIDGLMALSACRKDAAYADEAARFTDTLLAKGDVLTADGVIREKLSSTGWDTALFKGPFVRALGHLRGSGDFRKNHAATAEKVDRALRTSATSLLAHSVGKDGQYGLQWQSGAEGQEWNFNTQLSALMALTAAAATL